MCRCGHRRHARAQLRPHRQHRLDQRPGRPVRPGELRRRQVGHPRLHQGAGPGRRRQGHHRQRHRARLYRHRHGARRAGRRCWRRSSPASRSAGSARPRRSPAACCSWSPTTPASSPARRSRSTAASICISCRLSAVSYQQRAGATAGIARRRREKRAMNPMPSGGKAGRFSAKAQRREELGARSLYSLRLRGSPNPSDEPQVQREFVERWNCSRGAPAWAPCFCVTVAGRGRPRGAAPTRDVESERWTPCPAGNRWLGSPSRLMYFQPEARVQHENSKFKAIVFCVSNAIAQQPEADEHQRPQAGPFPAGVQLRLIHDVKNRAGGKRSSSDVNIIRTYATRVKHYRGARRLRRAAVGRGHFGLPSPPLSSYAQRRDGAGGFLRG